MIDNWGNEWGLHHAAQLALWSQLKTGNIQRAKKCLEVYKKAVLELYNGINLKDINVERSTDLLRTEDSIFNGDLSIALLQLYDHEDKNSEYIRRCIPELADQL